jgi:thiol:disulfide interchange protein
VLIGSASRQEIVSMEAMHITRRAALLSMLAAWAGCQQAAEQGDTEHAEGVSDSSDATLQGGIRFVEGYRQGSQQASREGKPMLVFFTASWCHYCHEMAAEAFCEEGVIRLSERFVCVLVDADRDPELCRLFEVRGFPTIQFLSPQGVALHRVVGKKPGQRLVIEMQAALHAVARRQASPYVQRL